MIFAVGVLATALALTDIARVSSNFTCSDPFIVRDDAAKVYRIYQNVSPRTDGGMAHVVMRTSKDLLEWSEPIPVMKLDDKYGCDSIWAPEVHPWGGKWYIFGTIHKPVDPNNLLPILVPNWNPSDKSRFKTYLSTWIFRSDTLEGPFAPFSDTAHLREDWSTLDGTLYVEDGKPYLVFCHEWTQMRDGTFEMVQLKDDLSAPIGPTNRLFYASEAWGPRDTTSSRSYVSDGPFFYQSTSGKLLMLWSTGGYRQMVSCSDSGKLAGPWSNHKVIYEQDGGHGMVFKTFAGDLRLILHSPNTYGWNKRIRIFKVEDTGSSLKLGEQVAGCFNENDARYIGPSNDNAGESSLTNKASWADAKDWTPGVETGDGYWTGCWQPNPAKDYVLSRSASSQLRVPRFDRYRFGGRSLRIGDYVGRGEMQLSVGKPDGLVPQELDFPLLICDYGTLGVTYTSATVIHGPVAFVSNPADGQTTFAMQMNQATLLSEKGNRGIGLTFDGKVYGDTNTLVECRIFNFKSESPYDNCKATNSVYAFTGDLSELQTTVRLRPWKNLGRTASTGSAEHDRRIVTFATSCSEMPGKLEVWRGGCVRLMATNTNFRVGGLELAGGAQLEFTCDLSAGTGTTMTVAREFSVSGTNRVVVAFLGSAGGSEFRHALLRVPVGSRLSLASFTFAVSKNAPPHFFFVAPDEESRPTLWVSSRDLVELTASDAANVRESYRAGTGSLTNGWCDLAWPTPDKDYLVVGKTLRTPQKTTDGKADYGFEGRSLTLQDGAALHCRATIALSNANVRLLANTADVAVQHISKGALKLPAPFSAGSGVCLLTGRATVRSSDKRAIAFKLSTERAFRHDWELAGRANISYVGYCEKTQPLKPIAFHWLNRQHPNLVVPITRFAYQALQEWTGGGASVMAPSMDYNCRVYLEDPLCLGRPTDAFVYNALSISDYTAIYPLKSMTLDDPNRGISIYQNLTAPSAPVARFNVTNGVTLTVGMPINFSAEQATLIKEGAGELVFGAGCVPTFWKECNPNPSVTSNNLFRILEGGFRPTAYNVCDGLQVSFANAAELRLDAAPADTNLVRYGLYNNKWRRSRTDRKGDKVYPGQPLSVEAGSSVIRIVIDAQGAQEPAHAKLGLVTVGSEYADEVARLLQVESAFRHHGVKVMRETFAAPALGGTLTTFSAEFVRRKRGTRVSFR